MPFLFGILTLGLDAGTFRISGILAAHGEGRLDHVTLATLLLLGGVIGKSAQFPLHTWLPDAMAGPTPVSALIHAATMVAAGIYVLARLWPLYVTAEDTRAVLAVLAAITMLGAALAALAQDDIKRVLAYSTISQLAYMSGGLAVGGRDAAVFHLISHGAFKALLFLAAGALIHAVGTNSLARMGGLRTTMPVTFLTMTVGLGALAGLPPFSGFFSKDAVLVAADHARHDGSLPSWAASAVLASGLATVLVTAAYVTRMWLRAFFGPPQLPEPGVARPHDPPLLMALPLVVLAAPAGLLGLAYARVPAWLYTPGVREETLDPVAGTAGVSIALAVMGAIATWRIWALDPTSDPARALGRLQPSFQDAFYVDAVYDRAVVRPVRGAVTGRPVRGRRDRRRLCGRFRPRRQPRRPAPAADAGRQRPGVPDRARRVRGAGRRARGGGGVMTALPLLLMILPAAGVLVLLALPGELGDRAARLVGLFASTATLVVAVVMAFRFDTGNAGRMQFETNTEWVPAIGMRWHLGVDGVSLPLVVLTAALSFLCLVHSMRTIPDPGRPRAFVGLLLLLEVGMLGSFVVLDLLVFFVFFEVVLLPMWWLIAVWGDGGPAARPAANRFILYTLLGSAFMLIGFLIVWANTGTLDMVELAARRGAGMSHGVQVLAFSAMLAGFAIKTPMWPLHTWLPGAHTAAPTVGSVLLAGVLLKMGTYGLVRTALPVTPEGAAELAPYLGVLAVIGIVYGSLACLGQRDLKRLIAYSSVGHMGFVLLGLATLTPAGINGALFGNVAHGVITGLLFFLVGSLKYRYGTADLDKLGGGIYARAPRLGVLLAFAAVASLGLPGLAGFWGEFLAITGAFQPAEALHRGLFLTLMVIAGIGTVLTAAYLLVMVRRVCMGPGPAGDRAPGGGLSAHDALVWAPLVLAAVVLGLWPKALLSLTDPAVQALLGGG